MGVPCHDSIALRCAESKSETGACTNVGSVWVQYGSSCKLSPGTKWLGPCAMGGEGAIPSETGIRYVYQAWYHNQQCGYQRYQNRLQVQHCNRLQYCNRKTVKKGGTNVVSRVS